MAQDAATRPLAEVEPALLEWLACPWGWPTTGRDARPHRVGSRSREAFLGTLHLLCACAVDLQLTPAHKTLAWCLRPDHVNAVLHRCRQSRRAPPPPPAVAAADAAPLPAVAAAAAAAPPVPDAGGPVISAGRLYQFAQAAFKVHTWLRVVDPCLSAQPAVRDAENILRTAMHQVLCARLVVSVQRRAQEGDETGQGSQERATSRTELDAARAAGSRRARAEDPGWSDGCVPRCWPSSPALGGPSLPAVRMRARVRVRVRVCVCVCVCGCCSFLVHYVLVLAWRSTLLLGFHVLQVPLRTNSILAMDVDINTFVTDGIWLVRGRARSFFSSRRSSHSVPLPVLSTFKRHPRVPRVPSTIRSRRSCRGG